MNIFVNNEQRDIPAHSGITDTLSLLNISSLKGVAIAVNNSVVPKAEWEAYRLTENDKITIIKATQGG